MTREQSLYVYLLLIDISSAKASDAANAMRRQFTKSYGTNGVTALFTAMYAIQREWDFPYEEELDNLESSHNNTKEKE